MSYFRLHVSVITVLGFLFLSSLSMIISRFIHVAANGIISFIFVSSWLNGIHCIYVPQRLYPFLHCLFLCY